MSDRGGLVQVRRRRPCPRADGTRRRREGRRRPLKGNSERAMNISIEVGHPAHVHYWRPVRAGLIDRGHKVTVLARGKETTFRLLRALGIPFVEVGRNYPTLLGKGIGMIANSWDVLREASRAKVDIMLSGGMPYSAQASAILDVPHLAIIDT